MAGKLDVSKFAKGQIWYMEDDISDKVFGQDHLLRGNRPVLIIGYIFESGYSAKVTILPITHGTSSKEKGAIERYYLHPLNEVGGQSFVECNQPETISTNRLTNYLGCVAPNIMNSILFTMISYLQADNAPALRPLSTYTSNITDAETAINHPYIIEDKPIPVAQPKDTSSTSKKAATKGKTKKSPSTKIKHSNTSLKGQTTLGEIVKKNGKLFRKIEEVQLIPNDSGSNEPGIVFESIKNHDWGKIYKYETDRSSTTEIKFRHFLEQYTDVESYNSHINVHNMKYLPVWNTTDNRMFINVSAASEFYGCSDSFIQKSIRGDKATKYGIFKRISIIY